MSIERWFITGTDTDVGKTVASRALLSAAAAEGKRTAGYKPVASGCEHTAHGLRNSDALFLQAAATVSLDYATVNPVALAEATSPHIASAAEGIPITFNELSEGLRRLEHLADWILVEGAGGWRTPLCERYTLADWVKQEQLPVILVVGVKLGCINHAALTAEAIARDGLRLVGWVANCVVPEGNRHQEYMETLLRILPAPLLGELPYSPDGLGDMASYFSLELLGKL